jgi:hypothetical protein
MKQPNIKTVSKNSNNKLPQWLFSRWPTTAAVLAAHTLLEMRREPTEVGSATISCVHRPPKLSRSPELRSSGCAAVLADVNPQGPMLTIVHAFQLLCYSKFNQTESRESKHAIHGTLRM